MVKIQLDLSPSVDQFLQVQKGVLRISDKKKVILHFLEKCISEDRTPKNKLKNFMGL